MHMVLRGHIRNGRVELDEPIPLPDGTAVVVAAETSGRDDGPVPPDEIARVLAAMDRLRPLEMPDDITADLEAWERKLEQHGIDRADDGLEDVFR